MDAYYSYLNDLITINKQNYAAYPTLKWLSPYEAPAWMEKRQKLLNLQEKAPLFNGTKPYHHQISEGCRRCGKGLWSCLFITGKCNANCFYCPAAQHNDEVPTSQGLEFHTPEQYAAYVNHVGFEAVSFSGGEPLLVFDRTLSYLKSVRQNCNPDIYIWMYTNGILATPDKLKLLAEAGLNEIRFDIGATGNSLDKLKLAQGIIPNISIEIPAIPEEKEEIMRLLPEMMACGVTNLNLHQLRLTPYNVRRLVEKDYTYIAAEKPLVLESEIAALKIIEYARKQNLTIGINYCSFFFKSRHQPAGFRKHMARVINTKNCQITDLGYLREQNNDHLTYYSPRLSVCNEIEGETVIEIGGTKYNVEQNVILKRNVQTTSTPELHQLLNQKPEDIPIDPVLFDIWRHEWQEVGLRPYY